MNVLLAASECAPLVKVGGIADVIGSLPIALKAANVDARVVIPYYKPLKESLDISQIVLTREAVVEYGGKKYLTTVYRTHLKPNDVPVYLLDNEEYLGNGGVYYSPDTLPSPESELERFAFFSKAVTDIFTYHNDFFNPDVIHCNDWHTGIIPQLMQARRFNSQTNIKTIFTIHNLGYQGFSKIDVIEKLGMNPNMDATIKWDMQDDNVDFVLQGIVGSDYVTTVSERYAEEIQTVEFGEGLHDIIQARRGRLVGILNGISYEVFNPQSDTHIYAKYGSSNHLEGKTDNKMALLKTLGLDTDPNKPLLGIVSRLVTQKGLDVVVDSISEIINLGYQIVVLGTGEPFIEERFKEYNDNPVTHHAFKANILFSEEMARKIYAASDMFLIPSRYEPCGLTQMIAMKYGSVPVVRATGGLYDTVQDMNTGFTFNDLTKTEMLTALERAVNVYKTKDVWNKIVKSCMAADFSWDESAKKYINLYSKTITNL